MIQNSQELKESALFAKTIMENMELDWQCTHPDEVIQQDNEPVYEEHDDPNIQYIFELCSSIREKLDLLRISLQNLLKLNPKLKVLQKV